MSDQLVPNAFGEMVLHRVTVPKVKIKDMSPEERKHYNAEMQQKSRDKKKLAEEIADEAKRFSEQQRPQEEYQARESERTAKSTPFDWEDTIHVQTQPVIQKILDELQPWYYPPRRVEGNLILGLHGLVQNTVQELGAIIFGVPEKFFQMDGLGFRVAGYFPDSVMHEAVRLDKSILSRSKAFRDFYEQALRATVTLLDQAKYQEYMQWGAAIRNELQNLHNDIDFAR